MSQTQKPSSSRSRRDKDDTTNPDVALSSIGNYAFQKTVGEGNFAKVKLAKHKLTGAEVAVKIIDKTTLDEKKLGKLYREVRIMKMLHHPHIVKLYEVIETKNTVFLVMEYAAGGELYDYLVVHGKMKEKEARAKFRQILSAVNYCHKKRVIHRDLKAENLLLDANLDIKIADFGFSNYYDPESKLDTFCGSPPYAAPELFQGRRYTGPEVDIWSLGVILYVLTTGCLPFDGKNLQEMRESVCRGKYRIPFYLSDSCEKLLRKFLIRDPYKRASLDMLLDDIWINDSYPDSPLTGDISLDVVEDDSIIRTLESKFHIDRETVLHSLRENLYDDVAANYYLLYYEKMGKLQAQPASAPLSISTNSPPQATVNDEIKSAQAAFPPVSSSAEGKDAANAADMDKIEEDSAGPLGSSARPMSKQKPRKRRFTVAGEADMQKMADEDEGGAESMKKAQGERPMSQIGGGTHPIQEEKPSHGVSNLLGPSSGSGNKGNSPTAQPVQNNSNNASAASQSPSSQNNNSNNDDDASTAPGGRKRHNTIVGLLRNNFGVASSRRQSADSSTSSGPGFSTPTPPNQMNAIAESGQNMSSANTMESVSSSVARVSLGEDGKPRSLRFTFNSNTTSSKPPDKIIALVAAACDSMHVQHRLVSRYLLDCYWAGPAAAKDGGLKFEIEVCKLPRLKNLHGLRFKRVSGSSSDYKDVIEKMMASVQL